MLIRSRFLLILITGPYQCFSNWVLPRAVRDSQRRKCLMANEFYLRF